MKKYKIWTAIMLNITLVMMVFCITIDVSATSVFPSDDDDHYYCGNSLDFTNWNISDILTRNNYDTYFDELSGELKTGVVDYFSYEYGSYTDQVWFSTLQSDYTVTDNGYFNFDNCYFKPIVIDNNIIPISDCKKVIGYQYGSNNLYCVLLYSPTEKDIAFGTGARHGFISEDIFYMSYNQFPFTLTNIDNVSCLRFSASTGNTQIISTKQGNQGFPPDYYACRLDNLSAVIYSDATCLFQASETNTIVGQGCTPDYYSTNSLTTGFAAYGTAWIEDTDTTGFVIDRRTPNFIDVITPNDTDQIIQDGFDPMLFDGSLGFNWFNSNGSINYVSSLNQYKPFVQLKYKINNYTDIHKDDVSIIWDSTISMKLTYDGNNDSTRFITSCKYAASGNWDLVGHENQFTLLASQESNLYTLSNVRSTSGSNPYGNEFRDSQNINQNITYGISAYRHDADVVTNTEEEAYNYVRGYFSNNNKGHDMLDSYGFIYFNVYLKNNTTGETSIIYSSVFDLFNNKFQDNSSELINNDDSAYNDFMNSFNYLDQDGELSLVEYAKPYNNSSYGYGGNASIGNITIGASETIVDMSADEWLRHSPNYNELITTIKTGLVGVGENSESVTALLTETYSVFPVPIWSYLTLAIATISALAVIRYIRRG